MGLFLLGFYFVKKPNITACMHDRFRVLKTEFVIWAGIFFSFFEDIKIQPIRVNKSFFLTQSLGLIWMYNNYFLKKQVQRITTTNLAGGPVLEDRYMKSSTGYSFWDWLLNFLHKFTWIVLSVHKLNKLGKFWAIAENHVKLWLTWKKLATIS